MFVNIGRQYVNIDTVTTIDEGVNGMLRLCMADGKTVYARQPEEIEQVKAALDALTMKPASIPAPATAKSPEGGSSPQGEPKASSKKRATHE